MRTCLLLALAAGILNGAVIRGVVVENPTGKPLMRAMVTIQPVPGSPGTAATLRTSRFGTFDSPNIPGGVYIMTISRTGFLTMQYGQKEWKSSGYPIVIQDGESSFLNIRMWRLGAITGTVVDEEEIGLPDHEVVAYRNTRPPQLVTRAKTDDRGMYRLNGLLPGSYLVRTVGRQYDEGAYLPTFHREAAEVDQANVTEVRIDEETRNVNVRPRPGGLVNISGSVAVPEPGVEVTVTLVNDMGRHVHKGPPIFRFVNMPPGPYELYGEAPSNIDPSIIYGGSQTFSAARPDNQVRLQLSTVRGLQVRFQGSKGQTIDSSRIQILARRKDAAGTDDPIALRLAGIAALLAPGRWEFTIAPTPEFYVAGFGGSSYNPNSARTDGWNETSIGAYSIIRFTISNTPGAIRGAVTTAGKEPVAGAPVYLEAWDVEKQQRVIDMRETRTDIRGQYQFRGLAPGNYRLLSTFDYRMPDSATMEMVGAKNIKVEDGREFQVDLSLWAIR